MYSSHSFWPFTSSPVGEGLEMYFLIQSISFLVMSSLLFSMCVSNKKYTGALCSNSIKRSNISAETQASKGFLGMMLVLNGVIKPTIMAERNEQNRNRENEKNRNENNRTRENE